VEHPLTIQQNFARRITKIVPKHKGKNCLKWYSCSYNDIEELSAKKMSIARPIFVYAKPVKMP
jgi:hypothetical protein